MSKSVREILEKVFLHGIKAEKLDLGKNEMPGGTLGIDQALLALSAEEKKGRLSADEIIAIIVKVSGTRLSVSERERIYDGIITAQEKKGKERNESI